VGAEALPQNAKTDSRLARCWGATTIFEVAFGEELAVQEEPTPEQHAHVFYVASGHAKRRRRPFSPLELTSLTVAIIVTENFNRKISRPAAAGWRFQRESFHSSGTRAGRHRSGP
jgi:hypothetical protein